MGVISCVVNFKENFTKNIPYYNLLINRINDSQTQSALKGTLLLEHCAICCSDNLSIMSKICEGYQFIIAFDGQLYNTYSLKNELKSLGYAFTAENDAELALNCYIHYGDKSPEKLSGCFSFVIYDTMRRQLFAANDKFSSVPLFYSKCDEFYILASQINGIFAHPDIVPKLTCDGLSKLLSFSKGSYENIFENVFMLPPGHILKIKGSDLTSKKYSGKTDKPLEFSPDFLCDTLKSAVNEIACEKAGYIFLGGATDELTFSAVAKAGLEKLLRTAVFSFSDSDAFKKYSAEKTDIIFDEHTLLSAITNCVSICGIPTMSCTDFLINLALGYIPNSISTIFSAFPLIDFKYTEDAGQIIRNKLLHKPVFNTLLPVTENYLSPFNSPRMLAAHRGMNLISPYFLTDTYAIYNKQGNKSAIDAVMPSSFSIKLKRILLSILADDTAPILAFFNKSNLLKLCEREFYASDLSISEAELISYIIKLNIWFLKYRPKII